jgi:hypothetical protein
MNKILRLKEILFVEQLIFDNASWDSLGGLATVPRSEKDLNEGDFRVCLSAGLQQVNKCLSWFRFVVSHGARAMKPSLPLNGL